MTSTSTAFGGDRPARLRLAWLALVACALLVSCTTRPATALVFRVMAENLVPVRCDQDAYSGTDECPASAYRIESVVVRVCRGACPMPDSIVCQPADLLCETYADGLMRTARTVLPGDVTVAPADPDSPGRVGVVVIASVRVPDADRAELIRRRFVVPFVRESTRVVEVWLTSLCIGVQCPPETSCGRRSCEPVENPPTQSFSPLPEAGVLDAGDLDAAYDAPRADIPRHPSDVSDASDVSVSEVFDAPPIDVTDASMDASDAPPMDVLDAPPMDAFDASTDEGDELLSARDASDGGDVSLTDVVRVDAVGDAPGDVPADVACGSCPSGTTCCAGRCVDLMNDPVNCGRCGFGCVSGSLCAAGTCERIGNLAAGGEHTCAFYGRALRCWGRNNDGRIGAASVPLQSTPTAVGRGGDRVSVSASHSCSWSGDGSIQCWGSNARGALGAVAPSLTSYSHSASFAVGSAAAGEDFSCATRGAGDGEVVCWGANDVGQCGQSGTADVNGPTTIGGIPRSGKVVAGRAHACALSYPGFGGVVYCWGANDRGQIGTGAATAREAATRVTLPGAASDLFAGRDHTCAIVGASLYCWGGNRAGQVDPSTGADVRSPRLVAGFASSDAVVQGAAGDEFSCAVVERTPLTSRFVLCWGTSGFGEFGAAPSRVLRAPTAVAEFATVREIVAGARHLCVRSDAALSCWGSNRWGQLGIGTSGQPRSVPAVVRGASATATAVSVGYGHACAVLDGEVRCWGKNTEGQLGTGDDVSRSEPVRVTTVTMPTAVCAGEAHTCAMSMSGAVQCWGRNVEGQLGTGAFSAAELSSVGVLGVTSAGAISCGRQHTCVIRRADGAVLCWGANSRGQLGNSVLTPSASAALVRLGMGAVRIAAGGDTTCAALADGTVRCWGDDRVGQLGNGMRPASDGSFETMSETPLTVPGVTGASGVSVGAVHACAWSGTQAWCWGFNGFAQLGRGAATMRGEAPGAVTGLAGAVGMGAGFSHSCAFDRATLRCWGRNHAGQVGDSAAVSISSVLASPTSVAVTGPLVTVSAGGGAAASDVTAGVTAMTCSQTSEGVRCWGSNEWGELGDGASFSAAPMAVPFSP